MTGHPTPEAIEAVVEAMSAPGHDFPHAAGQRVLAFIRDAIHRDGPDADAIRETLGLHWEQDLIWSPATEDDPCRRLVGKWQSAGIWREFE